MLDQHTVTKVAETAGAGDGHFTFMHMVYTAIGAALTGGLFNPVVKYIMDKMKKKAKDKKHHHTDTAEAAVKIAEIEKDEKTENKLWERIESLEGKLQKETEARLESERKQQNLQRQIDELQRDRLYTLSRYIHLKLKVEQSKREIDYLKIKLKEKDPDFDKDYPNFSVDTDALRDENLINEIIKTTGEGTASAS